MIKNKIKRRVFKREENIQMDKEILLKSYLSYLESLRRREENFLKFLSIVLPPIGGILYIFKNFYSFNIPLITISILIITIYLLWIILYIISSSYTYRYLQIQLCILEKELNIPHPPSWDPEKRIDKSCKVQRGFQWKLFPENQKMHAISIYLLILISWIGFIIILSPEKKWKIIITITGVIGLYFIIYFIISGICIYYEGKLEDIINNPKN